MIRDQLVKLLGALLLLVAASCAHAGPAEEAIHAGGVALLIRHACAPGWQRRSG